MANIEFTNESLTEIEFADFQGLIEFVFEAMYLNPKTEIGVTFVDKEEIRVLNKEWLDADYATDVLSFPMDELRPGSVDDPRSQDFEGQEFGSEKFSSGRHTSAGMLGDLVLCPAVAAEQATTRGHTTIEELQMLTVHGILHLLGFDHEKTDDETEMFALQNRLLKTWGTANGKPWVEHFGTRTIEALEALEALESKGNVDSNFDTRNNNDRKHEGNTN